MKEKRLIPLIKENRISKLIDALNCFNKYSYNREKQRECVLELYPNKSEKSVFRGMVIPSLRYLGLIVGYEGLIRISANGKLILEGKKKNEKDALRVIRTIILELDKKTFIFMEKLKNMKKFNKKDFINLMSQEIEGPSEKQKEERIKKWLGILKQCKLIKSEGKNILMEKVNFMQAEKELNMEPKKQIFRNILFNEYKSLPYSETAGIVDIVFLRELVSLKFFKKYNMILTESKFDNILTKVDFVTDSYIISPGHSMGAEEKLFYYNGEYYRTLSITFSKEVGKNG